MNAIEKFKWEIDRRRVHSTAAELPVGISMITLTLTIQEAKDLFAEIKKLRTELTERGKQVKAAFEIIERYTPVEKLDQANNEMILAAKGITEKMGRDLLQEERYDRPTIAEER